MFIRLHHGSLREGWEARRGAFPEEPYRMGSAEAAVFVRHHSPVTLWLICNCSAYDGVCSSHFWRMNVCLRQEISAYRFVYSETTWSGFGGVSKNRWFLPQLTTLTGSRGTLPHMCTTDVSKMSWSHYSQQPKHPPTAGEASRCSFSSISRRWAPTDMVSSEGVHVQMSKHDWRLYVIKTGQIYGTGNLWWRGQKRLLAGAGFGRCVIFESYRAVLNTSLFHIRLCWWKAYFKINTLKSFNDVYSD